jgi:hypothetical protein
VGQCQLTVSIEIVCLFAHAVVMMDFESELPRNPAVPNPSWGGSHCAIKSRRVSRFFGTVETKAGSRSPA